MPGARLQFPYGGSIEIQQFNTGSGLGQRRGRLGGSPGSLDTRLGLRETVAEKGTLPWNRGRRSPLP